MPRRTADRAVRDRLLDAADRLFYREGVRAVGIDRVLAEAGAAKASLYSHFRCKDELVGAYIERRAADARARIDAFMQGVPRADRAQRFFDWILAWVESPDFRGCPMQHVVGELPNPAHPARRAAAAQRAWVRERLTEWAAAAGATDPATTARTLHLLFDGAVAAAEQDGAQPARDAARLAGPLLRASSGGNGAPRRVRRSPGLPKPRA